VEETTLRTGVLKCQIELFKAWSLNTGALVDFGAEDFTVIFYCPSISLLRSYNPLISCSGLFVTSVASASTPYNFMDL